LFKNKAQRAPKEDPESMSQSSRPSSSSNNTESASPTILVQCSAVLFDLDGVLVDSTPAVARVWTRWALAHGFDPQEVVARAHGRPSLTTVREYLPLSDAVAENKHVERAEIEDLDGVVPLPGTLDLLASLPPHRWTIVTSCSRALAEVRIRAAGLPVPPLLVTSSDIVRGKPDPEPYLKGAAILGFPAEQCVVLEDAPAGIHAGKAAGARVIALQTTSQPPALRAAGADWIVNNCADIRADSASQPALTGITLTLSQVLL
jgi:mannitol-1-/sugar-/sorbitol-6-phosphatase